MSIDEPPRALVTGAARGIGKAICLRLLNDGWEVIGTVRGPAENLMRAAGSAPLELVRADLNEQADLEHLIDRLSSSRLRGMVHNAGVIHEERRGFSQEKWQETLQVNVIAPMMITQSLAGHLQPGGAVVAIASTDALRGSYDTVAYGASKAALINAMSSLANVLGPRGIRVNTVSPGWVDTDMGAKELDAAVAASPLRRIGRPEEIASTVSWLLSEEAAFVTGTNVIVDGGYTNSDSVLEMEAAEPPVGPQPDRARGDDGL